MIFNQPIIPIALDAFFSLESDTRMAAWAALEVTSSWLEEPGSDLEEAIYVATFKERWGDDIDAEIYERIVRMLEPYRETETPEWLQ